MMSSAPSRLRSACDRYRKAPRTTALRCHCPSAAAAAAVVAAEQQPYAEPLPCAVSLPPSAGSPPRQTPSAAAAAAAAAPQTPPPAQRCAARCRSAAARRPPPASRPAAAQRSDHLRCWPAQQAPSMPVKRSAEWQPAGAGRGDMLCHRLSRSEHFQAVHMHDLLPGGTSFSRVYMREYVLVKDFRQV